MSHNWMRLRRRFEVAFALPWHLLSGIVSFWRRALPQARDRFDRVIDIRPDHFLAHIYLGRIALLEDNEPEGLRELRTARRIDPRRFSRMGLIEEYAQHYDLGEEILGEESIDDSLGFDCVDGGTSMAPPALSANNDATHFDNRRPGREPNVLGARIGIGHSPSESVFLGDFTGPEEKGRFQGLKPIRAEDIRAIDWERVDSGVFER